MEISEKGYKPFISIAIITYNRANLLKRNIENLLNIIKENNYRIEILVLNNGSTDSSIEVLNNFENEIQVFNYYYNLGINPAISILLNVIKGQYLWFLGDDDFINKNAFKKTYELLNSDYNFRQSIFFPPKPFEDLVEIDKINTYPNTTKYNAFKNKNLPTLLLKKAGFISSHILPTNIFKKHFQDALKEIGVRNNYLVKYVNILSHKDCYKIIYFKSFVLFASRIKNNRSHFLTESISNKFQTFFVDNHRVNWYLINKQKINSIEKFKLIMFANTTLGSLIIFYEYFSKMFFSKRLIYILTIPISCLLNIIFFLISFAKKNVKSKFKKKI